MSRKKKCILFLSVIAVLFYVSIGAGLMREDSDMDRAMREIKSIVAKARRDIEKEMNKPFILRLFGSLFGMEGNSFQALKEDLPPVIKEAMPKLISKGSFTSPSGKIACEGMRLSNALALIYSKDARLASVSWTLDDTVSEGKYILLSGTVLKSEQVDDEMNLTIQVWHAYNGENGFMEGDINHLTELKDWVAASSNQTSRALATWLPYEVSTNDGYAVLTQLSGMQVEYVQPGD